MPTECLDFLPLERRRALRRAYLLRLATTAACLALALVAASVVLLAPTYLYLRSALHSYDLRIAGLDTELPSSDEATLAKRIADLGREGRALLALEKAPKVAARTRDVLAVPRSGIMLTGFGYAPAAKNTPPTFSVSGTAATRNALRSYQLALESVPGITKADLPVSSYAKEQDIPFTITASLADAPLP